MEYKFKQKEMLNIIHVIEADDDKGLRKSNENP